MVPEDFPTLEEMEGEMDSMGRAPCVGIAGHCGITRLAMYVDMVASV